MPISNIATITITNITNKNITVFLYFKKLTFFKFFPYLSNNQFTKIAIKMVTGMLTHEIIKLFVINILLNITVYITAKTELTHTDLIYFALLLFSSVK